MNNSKKENSNSTEQNLSVLINSTEDPIWLVDTNCAILECNSAFHKWVSHFIGCELSKGDNVLFDGKNKAYHDKFAMCYQLALNGKEFRAVEDMLIDGKIHYTTVNFKPIFDSNNKVTAVSCFARDITEHRQHLYHIEHQNAALREIAFIESHKIRGPVATILGLEQVYNYDNPSDPFNKEVINYIREVSLDLDKIIREVVKLTDEIGM